MEEKREPDTETRTCRIEMVIDEDNAKYLLAIFRKEDESLPECKEIGLIKENGAACGEDCPYLFRFGFDAYCTNQEVLRKHRKR